MSGQRTQTEVLIVGGGLVGLTAALLLRAHDVTTTLVEKRSSTSPQPKARRLHMRSMEIFRQLGLAGLVHDAARDLAGHDHMAVGDTLAEARQLPLWQAGGPGEPVVEPSPELPCLLSQDLLEPLLRKAALDAGVDVRFDTELLSVNQVDDSADAQLRTRRTGRRRGLTERRPAGWFAADESTRRTRQIQERAAPDPTLAHPYVLAVGGSQYTAGALIASAADPGDPEPTTRFNPRGRVGTRVPHRWLDPKRASSTIDLAGPHWAILTRHEPALIPASAGEPRVVVHQARDIDFGDDDELILLRPDHVVAWRGTGLSEAHDALRTILRPPGPGSRLAARVPRVACRSKVPGGLKR